jgi:hypothetical protein
MLKPEKIVKTLLQKNSQQKKLETGGTFNWTFFDNSNRTTFVQRLQKVGMFYSD